MLPRLESEEHLAELDLGRMSVGRFPQHVERQTIRRLERRSRGDARPKTAKADPAALGRIGIRVVGGPPQASQGPVTDG